MPILRIIYLGLAILGAIVPMYFMITWMLVNGFDLRAMTVAWTANGAVSGLAWDLVIAAVALSVWIISETYVRKNWIALLAIPATFCIGVSCGLPLFLFLRSGRIT